MDWRERIRNLWVERIVWIRHYIISLMMGLRDLGYVATRALRNGQEFGRILGDIYGADIGARFENIFTQHILILSELASTVKAGQDISALEPYWTEAINNFVSLLVEINPYWNYQEWQTIIYDQLTLQIELINLLNENKYAEGIELFDRAHENARQIGQKMVEGIERQFGENLVI